jgi:murein peptide amidase A
MRLGTLLTSLLTGSALAVGQLTAVPTPAEAHRTPVERSAVVEKRVIGHTVRGRPIRAYHLGERGYPKVVLISTMHGDESHTGRILRALRDGRAIHRLDLWVVPVYNPDGLARGTRKNARGVDLNRNYPYRWADLDGDYESGPRAGSEPETRAMMRFLRTVRPDYILSFHQPLRGVDTDTKKPRFARRVARELHLPATTLDCGSVCHGTMTMWFNKRFRGTALTVEYGAHPPKRHLRRTVPKQVLSIFGARYGEPAAELWE